MADKIVYKTVVVILGLCVIPIAIFTPMFQIVGQVTIADNYIGEHVSIHDIYQLFFSKNSTFEGFKDYKMTDEVRATMPWLITSGAFLGAALLLGIAMAVVAIVCRSTLPVLFLSIAACMAVFGLFRSFKAFAAPYLDGTINVARLGFMEEGVLEALVSAFVKIVTLQISSAGFLMFGAFAAVFLWTGAFLLVEWGEPDEKKSVKKHKHSAA